jgi:hypothetical protein
METGNVHMNMRLNNLAYFELINWKNKLEFSENIDYEKYYNIGRKVLLYYKDPFWTIWNRSDDIVYLELNDIKNDLIQYHAYQSLKCCFKNVCLKVKSELYLFSFDEWDQDLLNIPMQPFKFNNSPILYLVYTNYGICRL